MKRSAFYDPIRYLRDKGVTVRLSLPQGGKRDIELDFEHGRYWTPNRVLSMYKLVEQSRGLILLQLNVEKGLPPRSIESLLAKGYVNITTINGQRRYVITHAGKKLMFNFRY